MIPIHDDNPTDSPSYVTWTFLALCVLIFIFQFAGGAQNVQRITLGFGLVPAVLNGYAVLPESIYQIPASLSILTSMFLHGGFMHLAGNMLYLWIFGNNVEDSMGSLKFVFFYLLCGVAAAYSQVYYQPDSTIPMVGASGAISGVLGAYLLVYPRTKVLVVIPLGFILQTFRLPAAVVLLIWFAIQFISSLGADPNQPGVAWFAHIGGFVAGCLLIPLFKKKGVPLFQSVKR